MRAEEKKEIGFDEDEYCGNCGSSSIWEDCSGCGGEGGRGWEDLQNEDPLWYNKSDFIKCDLCLGKGGFNVCLNSECTGEELTKKQ